MRRTLALAVSVLALVAGCGEGAKAPAGSLSADPVAVLRATAAKTAAAGSSKLALANRTTIAGSAVTFSGEGSFAYGAREGEFTFTIGGAPGMPATTLTERITGGALYLQLAGQPGFYKIALADLVGTSLAETSDPTSSLQALAGVSDGVEKVGTEKLRGTPTTHYRGTIDVAKALAQLQGLAKQLAQSTLSKSGVKLLPFDAYVDDQGRMRKMVQNLTLTIKGQQATVQTSIEMYDFGTAVSVELPPAAEIHDGTPLLQALKSAEG